MSILAEFDPDAPAEGMPVPSPCVGICRMDQEKAWCAGCFRTIEEITCWSTAADQEKLRIWRLIRQRMF
ncbi:DUF1289 domain-containing protein [Undibacterium oligocarboniphilum]|uniref:DUF1289 domain-containing protein n=1 Tax=Undibacterium oligocarboniphilum TaxID=666702 RepID=A0A850QIC7_9BURK|nr:DUF1289 domain-containing protein [Undibacterium oligocarboniphilum]MBC3870857.1 DUF1289 domain-containing protein [Undibacterium oligocarboniphilum]NVO76520.1 DUF1289 domain-containing protein [Undibacterium oligocarboniphilum]